MTLLTIVVPSYNAADYLHRCVDSLLGAAHHLEIVIIDDGSSDATAVIAETYAASHPRVVRVIRQENRGHGGAVNAGVDAARGVYLKIVDSDDWLDPAALRRVVEELAQLRDRDELPDLLVTNFVYEKSGKRNKTVMRYGGALPEGSTIGWDEVGRFRPNQYLLMHALIYRTAALRASGLRLPEHTFYVDNLFASVPLAQVRTLRYLDVDLYRYFIGRDDQSVNEAVMVRRVDQQLRVNRLMVQHLPEPGTVPDGLYRYLLHYLEIVSAITSIMLVRAGGPEALAQREAFWLEVKQHSRWVHGRLRRGVIGASSNLPGAAGRRMSVLAYQLARRVVGFN